MPGSFIDERERSNEELKSKGRIEKGSGEVKVSSVLQNISKGMARLWKGCVNLFYSQVGRDKLSLYELNKGTLVYSQAEGQGPLRQVIKYDCNNRSNEKQVKEIVPTWSQNWFPPCSSNMHLFVQLSIFFFYTRM